jgi:drug/metabolite transporter (DMT)-like permease
MSRAEAKGPRATQTMVGIAFTVLAYFLFSFHDASIKWLVASLSVWQIMFARSAAILAGCLLIGCGALVEQVLRSRSKPSYLLLGEILLGAWQYYYNAARDLQLGELTTLYFTTPILAIVLARPILGERASSLAWAAAVFGFAGVVVASQPGEVGVSLPALLVLVASSLWALAQVVMRRLGRAERRERALVQMVYTNACAMAVSAFALPFAWHAAAPEQWAMMLALGLLGGGAQFALIEGFRRASPGALAPFQYTALIWAFALGYLIWGDVPADAVFIGAAMIVGAGLLILLAERRRTLAQRRRTDRAGP